MTPLTDTAGRSGLDTSALDRTDRILLGGCAAVWLAALGAGVAATVALVDLAHSRATSSVDSGTPWILYTVIGVSAVVIVAAVPLLLRARRDAGGAGAGELTPVEKRMARQAAERPQAPARAVDAPTEKLRVPPPDTNSGRLPRILQPSVPAAAVSPAVDRLWLRGSSSLVCAMGGATLAVCVATYLMAVDAATAAWVLYGVAGVATVGMAAIPWYFLRELRAESGR